MEMEKAKKFMHLLYTIWDAANLDQKNFVVQLIEAGLYSVS
jgi:hypothetical protein